jgi:acyl carrier protein
MTIEEVLNKVKEQFIDDQELSLLNLNPNSNFKKLDSYDSLTGMAIITTLEEEYDIKISTEKYKKIQTIRELYDYINIIQNQ